MELICSLIKGAIQHPDNLVGSLPVHSLTTMSMLPWIVAEIQLLSAKSSKEEPSVSQIRLCVSAASLRCEPDTGKTQQWDPLICSSLFEYKPQQVHKLIHNSHDPSYFACLIKDEAANQQSICYVFKADDQTKHAKASIVLEEERKRSQHMWAKCAVKLAEVQPEKNWFSIVPSSLCGPLQTYSSAGTLISITNGFDARMFPESFRYESRRQR
ncbi:hypothetical protein IHE44_0012958 [Lamprotornis superbus]|uniref:TBC1 domain family member 1 n=1 Tax=Lamprotornis superbus TaxID=245042 RepID=A0A835NU11_9PASS|nr:hypothetical protein IHE44_0012958 [Lamprotornis superbus]